MKGGFAQGIRDVVAIGRVGPGVFVAAALADGFGEAALEIAEEREGHLRAPFLAHEQHGDRGREQRDRERRFDRFRLYLALEPVAEGAVADLVVVLQEIDERRGWKVAARFAARLA